MSKPFASRKFMSAGWVGLGSIAAVAILAAAGIAGSASLRTHRGNTAANPVAAAQAPALSAAQRGRVQASLGALPLAFEANQGQTDPQVKYMARGNGYTVFLTANDTVFALQSSEQAATQVNGKPHFTAPSKTRTAAIHMHLVDGNGQPQIAAGSQLPGHSNYFIGNDRSQWHSNVAQYARVSYRDVYPGVDMAFYGVQKRLEFDFIVAPGASPAAIRLGVTGANRIATDPSGNLMLASSAGNVLLHKPVAYQQKDGARQPVEASFVLRAKNQVSFELGNYDRSRELVIDPSVSYATYLGGTSEDDGNAIAVDGSGNAYVTGQTKSMDFPTKNALYGTNKGVFDAFVTELSPTGTLVYSTYIGGTSNDSGNAIAVNASGDAFVAGGTNSSDFPTHGAYQSTLKGATNAFVLELNSTGSTLMYSTFLGGTGGDVAHGIALDSGGNAYVVGSTTSTDFPAPNNLPFETEGGFLTELNSSGNTLVYSTYLGAGPADFAAAVAVDAAGNAYVTGGTESPTFHTTPANVFQPTCGSDGNCNNGFYDAFVTVVMPGGSGFVYSTFLGGELSDKGLGIAVDSASGDAYVTGVTSSTKFPVMSPLQATFGGGLLDAFVTELNPTGTKLIYSTYLGGSGDDTGLAITVDSSQNAYVTGETASSNFPVASPTQSKSNGQNDAFVSQINAGGSALVFSTYLGGSLNENTATTGGGASFAGIAVDSAGSNIYVTGSTSSSDFPTVAAEQPTTGGTGDAFVAKYTISGFTVTNGALSPASGIPGVSATAIITVTSTKNFSALVTLACSVAPVVPKGPTCGLSPSSVTSANNTVTATLNLATTASSAMLERPTGRRSSGVFYAMLLPIGGIVLLGAGFGSAGSRRKKLFGLLMLGLLLTGLLLMPACSSSSGGGGGNTGTPTGTYTITVTGTSGSAIATGSPALSLTVN